MNKTLLTKGLATPIAFFSVYLVIGFRIGPVKIQTLSDLLGVLMVLLVTLPWWGVGLYLLHKVYLIWRNRTSQNAYYLAIGYSFIGAFFSVWATAVWATDTIMGQLALTLAVIVWGIVFCCCRHLFRRILNDSHSRIKLPALQLYFFAFGFFSWSSLMDYATQNYEQTGESPWQYLILFGYPLLVYAIYRLIAGRYQGPAPENTAPSSPR